MMWFVDVLVHAGVMLQAMNPVDGKIVESHVQYRREQQPGPAIIAHLGVTQAFATDLGQEHRQCQNVDSRNGGQGRFDLLADLILQKARMVLEPSVEDEIVG